MSGAGGEPVGWLPRITRLYQGRGGLGVGDLVESVNI